MIEFTVKVRDEEKTLTQKYLVDEGFSLSHDDPVIKKMVEETINNFTGQAQDVIIKAKAEW